LPWGSKEEVKEHLYKLQEKIKAYLDFIEDGQLGKEFPEHKNKPITINIVAKYELPPNKLITDFFNYAVKMVMAAGCKLEFSVLKK